MMNPDGWNSRTVKIRFINESDGNHVSVRKFRSISKGATEQQILQFGRAVSNLTPNGADGGIMADVFDHFMVFPEDDTDDNNQ